MRGEPVPIAGFTAMTGVLPSDPLVPFDPLVPLAPGDPLGPVDPVGPCEPVAPVGIVRVNFFAEDDHEAEGEDPGAPGTATTLEIEEVSSDEQTILRTPELRVICETLSDESQSLFPREIVEPRIPDGITIENLVPLYETTADGPVVILTTEEDPEKLKVGSGIGVGLELLETKTQRNESFPESSNFKPFTTSESEHFSVDAKFEATVSFWTDKSEKFEPEETNNELIPH
jgi:hypothetical protein